MLDGDAFIPCQSALFIQGFQLKMQAAVGEALKLSRCTGLKSHSIGLVGLFYSGLASKLR